MWGASAFYLCFCIYFLSAAQNYYWKEFERSLHEDTCRKKYMKNLAIYAAEICFWLRGNRKSRRPKVFKLAPEPPDNKMHKSLLKIHYFSELFNYPWLPLHICHMPINKYLMVFYYSDPSHKPNSSIICQFAWVLQGRI